MWYSRVHTQTERHTQTHTQLPAHSHSSSIAQHGSIGSRDSSLLWSCTRDKRRDETRRVSFFKATRKCLKIGKASVRVCCVTVCVLCVCACHFAWHCWRCKQLLLRPLEEGQQQRQRQVGKAIDCGDPLYLFQVRGGGGGVASHKLHATRVANSLI